MEPHSRPSGVSQFSPSPLPAFPSWTICPARHRRCANAAAEPAIRADGAGRLYGPPRDGLPARDVPGSRATAGVTFAPFLAEPELELSGRVRPGRRRHRPGRGAGAKRAWLYNVYVASLSLANVDVSTSSNGGRSWRLNTTGAKIPLDDREWLAADGRAKVCVSYHDVATSNIDVDCSLDAGATFGGHASAIDAAHTYLVGNNQIGNLAIDPRVHVVYAVFNGIANASEAVCSAVGTCGYHAVWIAVSGDGGRTFTDHPVYVARDASAAFNHQFVNVSIDRAGTVYAVFSDDRSVYYSFSRTRGRTWSAPVRVNRPPSRTAIFPWATAGAPGRLDVVWYGSSSAPAGLTPAAYPSSARWYVFFAQSRNADRRKATFRHARVTVIHRGGVCEEGVSCTGNRDLYDDFGVAASPKTGRAVIVYSDDQYRNDPRNRHEPGCTPKGSNSVQWITRRSRVQLAGPDLRP